MAEGYSKLPPLSYQKVNNWLDSLDIDHQGCPTNIQNCANDDLATIDMLDSDCLEQIFQFLPIVDLFRVQRVCKYWRTMSLDMCRRIRKLDMSRKTWGVDGDSNVYINLHVLARVLYICGRNLRYIGLSNDEDSHSVQYRKIEVASNKKLWIMISEYCPALTSIDFDQSCSLVALKFVSHAYRSLTHFRMGKFTLPGNSALVHEPYLADLFANNESLKRVELFDGKLTTECLAKLNPRSFQELVLDNCMIHSCEHLANALKELKNLNKMTMTRCTCIQETWINPVLEALTCISDSLKCLDFYPYNSSFEIVDPAYFGKLKSLENLRISGDTIINDDVLAAIVECCRQLRTLHIHNSKSVTNTSLKRVAELPELTRLILDDLLNSSDISLPSMLNIVNLEVHRCQNFENEGFENLIRNSRNLRSLKICNCVNIDGVSLIDEADRCPNDNLDLVIDNSETDSNYLECVYTLRKSHGKFMRMVKKVCYNCFVVSKWSNRDCNLCCKIVESNF